MIQRVYDDDDDVEDEGLEESKTDASSVADPLILMKDAFSFGQEALRLYYYDDVHTNKVEVWLHPLLTLFKSL